MFGCVPVVVGNLFVWSMSETGVARLRLFETDVGSDEEALPYPSSGSVSSA